MALVRNGFVQPIEGVTGGVPVPVTPTGGGAVNQPSFATGQTPVPTAGVAVQLNGGVSLPIPDGFQLVIKAPKSATGALAATTGTIYVGNSKAHAENHSSTYPLVKQEFIAYGITDVNLVWIDASVSGEGAVWTVEQA
jgi:hypothetical protein